jgi:hypothetical protein
LLINDDAEFVSELNNFTNKGNGTYAAAFGHDDMVMAEIQITFVRDTLQYKLLKDSFEESANIEVPDNIYNPFENMDTYMYPSEFMTEYDVIDNYGDLYRRLNGI